MRMTGETGSIRYSEFRGWGLAFSRVHVYCVDWGRGGADAPVRHLRDCSWPTTTNTHQTHPPTPPSFSSSIASVAPEVALHKPYNEKADVFSWSFIVWEMATLTKPFEGYTKVRPRGLG